MGQTQTTLYALVCLMLYRGSVHALMKPAASRKSGSASILLTNSIMMEFFMSYYKHHVFICTNKRQNGEPCCQDYDSQHARDYLKKRAKEMDIHARGNCRINSAGCLDRCEQGPVMVVYPEEIWYTWVDQDDLDEILESHLVNGRPVERLMLPND